MAFPSVIERLNDLEAGLIASQIREAQQLTMIIENADRTFKNTMALLGLNAVNVIPGSGFITPAGYIYQGNSVVAPVTIVRNGVKIPYDASFVLQVESIPV